MFQRKVALLLAFISLPCVLVAALARPSAIEQTPSPIPADTVLTNAKIETMDDAHPTANAVAIRGEQIVAVSYAPVGTAVNDDVQKLIGPHTRVIDLHGQFAMPGFNDAHLH